jgi:ATP/maltotriose-dependent transcriptional regulator MalT
MSRNDVRVMSRNDALNNYVARLSDDLKVLGATLPTTFRRDFIRYATRAGEDAYDELGQLLLLECLQVADSHKPLDEHEVTRALDRVRQKLIRRAKRWRERIRPFANRSVAGHRDSTPDKVVEYRDSLRMLLSQLSARDLMLVEMVADGTSRAEIAHHLGMKNSSVVRTHLSRLRARFRNEFPDELPGN